MQEANGHPRLSPRPARRSVAVVVCLGVGFWLARDLVPALAPWISLSAAGGLALLALPLRGWACRVALALSVVCLGAGWFSLRVHHRPADSLAALAETATDDRPVLLAALGVVTSDPEPAPPPRGALAQAIARERRLPPGTNLTLSVHAADNGAAIVPASGTLRVRLRGVDAPDWLRPGATVRIAGTLSPIRPALNPAEPDWRALATQDGVAGTLDVPTVELITRREPGSTAERLQSAWQGFRGTLHARALAAIGSGTATSTGAPSELPAARALIAALLLGETDYRLRDVSAAFTRLGLLHMVAISGFNLAVMAGAAMLLLRLTGDRGFLEPLIVALLVLAYLVVLPAQAPILRAGILVLALLLTESLGRRYDRVTVLGWVAVALLLVRPLDLFNLGFQLSFGVVAALLLLGDAMNQRLFGAPILGLVKPHKPPGKPRFRDLLAPAAASAKAGLKANVSASVLAWLVSTPVVAVHTGLVSPLAIATGFVVLPLTIVLLWAGYAALLLGTLVPAAAGVTGSVLDALGLVLVNTVLLLDRLPLTVVHLPRLWPAWALGAVATVVYAVLAPHSQRRLVLGSAALVLAALAVQVAVLPARAAGVPLRVDVLAVGEGSCQLVRSGGEALLIDAGSSASGLGERVIPQTLRELGVWRVPTAIITRPTLDAFSALPDLVEPLGLRTVYVPPALVTMAGNAPQGGAGELLRLLESRGVLVRPLVNADTLPLGQATISVHAPPITPGSPADASVALRIDPPAGRSGTGGSVLLLSAAPDSTIATLPLDTPVAAVIGRPRAISAPSVDRLLAAHPGAVVITSGRPSGDRPLGTDAAGALAVLIDERGVNVIHTRGR